MTYFPYKDFSYETLLNQPFIIVGPCVLESYELGLEVAEEVKRVSEKYQIPAVFKSSYDKANRSSIKSFRGPGLAKGLDWLAQIREKTELPIVTDIHEPHEADEVGKVADILQIPAFLCRQTSLLWAAGKTDKIVNVKKGQFLAPWEMASVADKIRESGNSKILLTERGNSFGYNNLVVDMRSFSIMSKFSFPVVFDATHSVQLPGAKGSSSGGDRSFVPALSRAAVAAGANGVFLECHPNPDAALCDGPNSLNLKDLDKLIGQLKNIWSLLI
ncbi:3-deoxy-8-phosphooctulonate synthase [Desulfovibrio litoralis]|uniref:2-dehydro-3-deoxyphosphooctonate aldolase n=1 Tax=Desulfovibrio litoralis DSM 11393 TaxID=1121455 RepID=A0A1M7SF68_9BACT|nr:3-deoxy-8-phosphooctulonate synthase [Desulfovibrio litoralis]SHN57138.1 2-dehydro-3-deoxyphosphooctonate aldolase (KDO 8-P synthase) [Desulfovibrio litoralis DSM 11393]